MDIILQLDAWIWGLALLAFMSVAWFVGRRVPLPIDRDKPESSSRIEDAAMALFGLLLAFCFAGAAGRYEARKGLLRDDAISIGDFATTASVLEEPLRTEIHAEVVRYVDQRLTFGRTRFDDEAMSGVLAEGRRLQDRMFTLVQRAVAEKNTPSIHTALLKGYNGMTMAHDQRLYGSQNHVPASIVVMLVILGVYAAFVLARMSGHGATPQPLMIRAFTYMALVSIVFTVTIDLEQPRRGMMRVSQVPMTDLRAALGGEWPGSR